MIKIIIWIAVAIAVLLIVIYGVCNADELSQMTGGEVDGILNP